MVASNRIDAIIARAYHLSRSEAAAYLTAEKFSLMDAALQTAINPVTTEILFRFAKKGVLFLKPTSLSAKKENFASGL